MSWTSAQHSPGLARSGRVLCRLETLHGFRTDPGPNEKGFGIMGLLSIFAKPAPTLLRLPAGSFTIDRQGAILVSTLPSSFPRELVDEIGRQVLAAFSSASQI